MIRDLDALTNQEFDVLVVGGGIFGIAAARDAAARGLSVALVERGDFAGATSANSFKIVHGGIRYLQHGDLPRIRESSLERTVLLRTAPHLVRPLPIVVPTYGSGAAGRAALRTGLALYDALVWDRNRGLRDPDRQVPPGRLISRAECLELFPGLKREGLSGGAVFYDAQMYNPPRLALSYLRSAVTEDGTVAANYLEVKDFLKQGDRVIGVRARDRLGGGTLEIRATITVNATGPWAERLVARALGVTLTPPSTFSRDACFVVPRQLMPGHGLALPASTRDPDAIVSRGRRHLFLIPWRHYTLVGVWHVVHGGSPDELDVTDAELQRFLDEVKAAYPALDVTLDEIPLWNAGLVLFGDNRPGATDLSYGKRSRIVDHTRTHGIDGLVTIVGVRWTTARAVADRAVRLVFSKHHRGAPPCTTAVTPVYGGAIDHFEDFLRQAANEHGETLAPESLRHLGHNYGAAYRRVLAYGRDDPSLMASVDASPVLKAEVVHAVREEMAQTLADVVLRRTDLGTGDYPGDRALAACAEIMARELEWSQERTEREQDEMRRHYRGVPAVSREPTPTSSPLKPPQLGPPQ
jgi:glycerol-3-phosphate dehydrogenase